MELDVQSVEHHNALRRNSIVFTSPLARYLQFVNAEPGAAKAADRSPMAIGIRSERFTRRTISAIHHECEQSISWLCPPAGCNQKHAVREHLAPMIDGPTGGLSAIDGRKATACIELPEDPPVSC
jgi:hypothetical protein